MRHLHWRVPCTRIQSCIKLSTKVNLFLKEKSARKGKFVPTATIDWCALFHTCPMRFPYAPNSGTYVHFQCNKFKQKRYILTLLFLYFLPAKDWTFYSLWNGVTRRAKKPVVKLQCQIQSEAKSHIVAKSCFFIKMKWDFFSFFLRICLLLRTL